MSFRYPAGLLTATSPVNAQYPSGVWTQQQSTVYQSRGLFATDPQFRYATMLLHGNGTNGAQNNTFLDSSTNNFTITRNGNTTQGTFTPYISTGYWSNYFSSNSGLTAPNNSAFKPATNDFTVECWVFQTSSGTEQAIYGDSNASTDGGTFDFNINSTGFLKSDYWTSNTAVTTRTSTLSPTVNQWNHVVLSRTGTTMYLGLNGVLQSFTAPSSYQSPATTYPTVGRLGAYTAGIGFIGYISNFRYINGTNLYSGSTYTVPTTPLTAVTNTVLLTSQSNRFIDNSTNAFALTVNGSPNVQDFQPFAPTTAYSTSVIGGSGYFDGSGDYLSLADNAALQWSTGDFCVEAWIYPSSVSGSKAIVCKGTNNTGTFDLGLYGAKIELYTNALVFSSSASLSANTWTHVAVTRSGTTLRCFINGALDTTVTSSYNFNNAGTFYVGVYGSASVNYFNGYMSDVRCVKGSAVYTSAFTPPTAPLTSITNTSLLNNFTNAGILDNAMSNDLETVGNAQISTSVVKYGTGSIYFDGSSSGLAFYTNLQNLQFSTGDFTIECWVNKTANGTNAYDAVVGLGSTVNATQGWYLEVSTSRGIYFVINNTSVSYATWVNDGLWHHIAVTRSSGTVYIFKDGVLLTSGSLSTTVPTTATAARVGNYYNGSTNYYFNGYIDELRITKGYARYTASFTAPIAPFPNQ